MTTITKQQINELIKSYVSLALLADRNPARMLSGEISTEQAAKIMSELGEASNKLFIDEIMKRSDVPVELLNYYLAINDCACGSCWMSSSGAKHLLCKQKIDKFFSTREELWKLGKKFIDNV